MGGFLLEEGALPLNSNFKCKMDILGANEGFLREDCYDTSSNPKMPQYYISMAKKTRQMFTYASAFIAVFGFSLFTLATLSNNAIAFIGILLFSYGLTLAAIFNWTK